MVKSATRQVERGRTSIAGRAEADDTLAIGHDAGKAVGRGFALGRLHRGDGAGGCARRIIFQPQMQHCQKEDLAIGRALSMCIKITG